MLKNYFKITFRSLLRFKTYLIVNVFGLSLGLACTFLAIVFVLDETSFDAFHLKAESIYRVNKYFTNDAGVTLKSAESSGSMGPQMLADYPEVKSMVRFQPWFDGEVISYNEKHFKEEGIAFADSGYFELFDFELIKGNPKDVLKGPGKIVLTKSLSQRIFGNHEPIGQTVTLFNLPFQVSGITEDTPRNSHMQFTAIISWESTENGNGRLNFSFFNNWLAQALNTYVELNKGTDIPGLEEKLIDMIAVNLPERKDEYQLYLQPFSEIYLGSEDISFGNFNLRLGSQNFVMIFNFIAIFILLIAAINYINISTSKAMRRALEVGVRKVLGAKKRQLFVQFVGEAFLVTLISGLLAVLIVDISIPYFNQVTDRHLSAGSLLSWDVAILFLGIIVITSLLSGAYPALVLSSYKPTSILKSGKTGILHGGALRKTMIVFQFFLATLMITSAIVVKDQNEFLLDFDLGVDSDQVVVVELQGEAANQADYIQNEIEKHPDILESVSSPAAIGGGTFGTTVFPEGFEQDIDIRYFRVDFEFIDVYGIKMNDGRGFDSKLETDENSVVINQTMADFLGWTDAIGKTIRFNQNGREYPVIGVTDDFNFYGPNKNQVEPMVMSIQEGNNNLSVRITANNTAEVLVHIENVYSSVEDKYPFEYYFVDDYFARQYSSEQNFLTIVSVFSLISIVISALGLYGLVSYFIEQRVKEIGIRKVLGASVMGIALMINHHFLKLIGISLVLSIPVSFWLMSKWLEDFANRVTLGALPFILSAVLITLVALVTTNNQALRASRRNPVNSLRYE